MMKEIIALSLVLVLTIESVAATQIFECGTGAPLQDLDKVTIQNCGGPPCQLPRGANVQLQLKFKPTRDVTTLTTHVSARVSGMSSAQNYAGVHGTNACDYIFDASGTKVGCPLTANTEYFYKRSFPVQATYPLARVDVHWALVDGGEDIACFEVKGKIVAKKQKRRH